MPKARLPAALKRSVARCANNRCEYCQTPENISPSAFHVEHIVPESQGGPTVLENLAWSCGGCNDHKYNKTEGPDPETGQGVALFNPRTQAWNEHFAWSEDFLWVVGQTPAGRATIEVCQINCDNLVRLRRLLRPQAKTRRRKPRLPRHHSRLTYLMGMKNIRAVGSMMVLL